MDTEALTMEFSFHPETQKVDEGFFDEVFV